MSVESKHADLLNELYAMWQSFYYAARRHTLRYAEQVIVSQEQEIIKLDEQVSDLRSELAKLRQELVEFKGE